MILKMKTKEGTSWKIIDNIKTINYEYINEEEMKKRKLRNNWSQNRTWLINIFKTARISPNFCEILVDFGNRIEYIYTDAIVYILNDKGETCDSIHV